MTCPHTTHLTARSVPCSQCLGVTPRREPIEQAPHVDATYRASARRGAAMRWRGRTRMGVEERR